MRDIEDSELSFDHAFCRADPLTLAKFILATDRALASKDAGVYNHLSKRFESIFGRSIYLWASQENDCLVFLQSNYNDLLARMSAEVSSPVHWMEAYEPMNARAYILFDHGKLSQEVLDPDAQIRTNEWSGFDLEGRGTRRFKSFPEFAELVVEFYSAKDQFWSHGRWENPEMREEGLLSNATNVHWAIQLSGERGTVVPLGQLPQHAMAWVPQLEKFVKNHLRK